MVKRVISINIILLIFLFGLIACSESEQQNLVTQSAGEYSNHSDSNGNSSQDETVDETQDSSEANADDDCAGFIATVFGNYADQVSVTCDENYYYVASTTGLPQHEIMRGITSWILRVPIPFDYTGERAWKIPRNPVWLDEHAETHARGPVAFAVNGVPIYHFDKRPDVDLGLGYIYDAKFDTVLQGELDHCGGHAGQGEDYHYHLAPICLLEDHDVSQPIAFSLGGASVYYGTGASDYYGEGQFNEINNLPDAPLDECNAVQMSDGSYVYYTTTTPPYVIGCHHTEVNWALQIEPRVIRDLGEFGRNAAELLSLTVNGDERTLTFRTNQGALQAIVYRPSDQGEHCWEFEFRTDVNQPATVETYCRPDL